MKKEMLINVLQPEESRIAIVEDGVLEELYVERNNQDNFVGNIYKGRVVNLEPSIQAAFVDFGVGRNGFLHVSDVEHQYFKHLLDGEEEGESRGRGRGNGNGNRRSTRDKPPIQDIFQRGSEVLVQVIKEGIGTKGPTLSTYISIPGRYLVLMPGLQRVGVSRKINDEEARRTLKASLNELRPPPGLGFIIRTAGLDRTRQDLQRDLNYLTRLWRTIVRRIDKNPAPDDIYEESDMITRTIRDIYTGEIDAVWIDEESAFQRAQEFMKIVMPRHVERVKLYEGREPLFHQYNIEEEISRIQNRHVPLPGGGSIVIDQTEALVAIDVNSGNFRVDDNAEETSYQVNLRAAEEICRQIRLRDLGGVIVNDFIDMREERHRRGVEQALRDAIARDRARSKVLRISPFGLIEMTRQRIRPSLRRSIYEDCPCCAGTGQVKTAESMAIDVMRMLMTSCNVENVSRVVVDIHEKVANYLNNRKRREITRLEETASVSISINARTDVGPEHLTLSCTDATGSTVRIPKAVGSKS
ncbi:MAG: Rne/Rng family ribonuclease [Planctomycetaceae bacterium]|nr:Rne/Rng family ribonuclease [Planctomycetaceae bacterium]